MAVDGKCFGAQLTELVDGLDGRIGKRLGLIDGLSHQVEGDVIYQKQGTGAEGLDCCHRAKTKNSGLLIPANPVFPGGTAGRRWGECGTEEEVHGHGEERKQRDTYPD